MNIYVGNLSPNTGEWQLREAFARYGKVGKINLDRQPRATGSYIFGFVEMPVDNQAAAAIAKLNGKMLDGCELSIRESAVGI